MSRSVHISVISPVYGAANLLDELVDRIRESVSKITPSYEILLVEDCGPDESWEKIRRICRDDPQVVGIQHSRNFGQQYALNCGMDHARGEWVVTLDCDLQDRPEEIINLYAKAQEGFDIVLARRIDRQDDVVKRSGSYLFYKVLSYLTDTTQDPSIANFAIYRRSVIDALASMHDYDRYYPTMIHWVGFRMAKLDTVHSKRKDDRKSSYTLHSRLSLAFDTMISFSDKPLRLTVKLGLLIAGIAAVSAMILVGQYFIGDTEASGWTSLFLSIWFLSGILIAIFGIVGVYVGRTFESVKKRPSYIVSEVLNGREG